MFHGTSFLPLTGVDYYLIRNSCTILNHKLNAVNDLTRQAMYCTVLYCIELYCTVPYCTALCCTVLYCTVFYCTVLCCTLLHSTVLYCTVLHCTLLYCTLLYCTCRPLYILITSRSKLLRMKNISDKSCRGSKNTHFMFSNVFLKSCG